MNVTLGKLNYTRAVCFYGQCTFLLILYAVFHVLSIKQTEEARSEILLGYRHYQYKYTFSSQDHIQ